MPKPDASGRAQAALDNVQTDTDASLDLAEELVRDGSIPAEARLIALWALGRAQHEKGRVEEACESLHEAQALAHVKGDAELESRISTSLALSLFERGQPAEADRTIRHASSLGSPAARAAALNQQAIMLVHAGELHRGLGAFDQALPLLEEARAEEVQARLLASRSTVHARLGQLEEAEADLAASTALARRLGMAAIVAGNEHNLGYVHACRGDIPAALQAYGRARASYTEAGSPARAMAILDTDLAETLLLAGLHGEALEAATRALAHAETAGHRVQLGESHLLIGRILLAAGRLPEAATQAETAGAVFRRSERETWANQADYIALQCLDGEPTPEVVAAMERITHGLASTGWRAEALHLSVLTGQAALALGDLDRARSVLEAASDARRRGTAAARADAWHATALLRMAEGNRRGAKRAVRAGLAVVHRHRAALGATELRARAAVHGADLAELGIRLALQDRRPGEVLQWAERARAGALRVRDTSPPLDAELADDLTELRRLEAQRRDLTLADRPTDQLERHIVGLERRVQARARLARGGDAATGRDLDPAWLRHRVDSRVLIEFVESDDWLHAVVVTRERSSLHHLGPVTDVLEGLGFLGQAHRRLAGGRGTTASLDAFSASLTDAATQLDTALLAPLPLDSDDVVVVPTGELHRIPWALLPSMQGRAVTVAPSATSWAKQGPPQARGERGVTLVAGPELPGGTREVNQLARVYDGAQTLHGRAATVEATLAACRGASVVHLAAHGQFRSDNPLFSSLQLSDGPLTIYELEQASVTPDTVVLPACGAASGEITIGHEVLGTAWALVAKGVRTVIAPLLSIADDPTSGVMLSLHQHLANGESPSRALAVAQASAVEQGDPVQTAAAAAFVTIGVDTSPPEGRT